MREAPVTERKAVFNTGSRVRLWTFSLFVLNHTFCGKHCKSKKKKKSVI